MKVWIDKLQQLQWQKLDRLSVVVLAILILWLCWKLASFFLVGDCASSTDAI